MVTALYDCCVIHGFIMYIRSLCSECHMYKNKIKIKHIYWECKSISISISISIPVPISISISTSISFSIPVPISISISISPSPSLSLFYLSLYTYPLNLYSLIITCLISVPLSDHDDETNGRWSQTSFTHSLCSECHM